MTVPTSDNSTKLQAPPGSPEGVRVHGVKEFEDEFVAHSGWGWYNHVRTLSPYDVQDVDRLVTPEELARMSRDPKIAKCRQIIRNGVLADDFQFAPGATESEAGSKPNYNKYVDVMQFCERTVSGLETPYWTTCEMMLAGALEQGHKIAEVTWEYRMDKPTRKADRSDKTRQRPQTKGWFGKRKAAEGDDPAGEAPTTPPNRFAKRATIRLMPKSIKVKPFGAARFVVDDFMNVLGIVPAARGQQSWRADEVISRDKFVVLTINPEDSDPRGNSAYRPAFTYIGLAAHIPRNYLKLLLQEGMPIPVLTLPDKTDGWLTVKDDRGQVVQEQVLIAGVLKTRPKMMSVAEAAERTLERMYLGKGVAIPFAAKLGPYRNATGNIGTVFVEALRTIYGIAEEAILLQPLAQSAGEVQSKSASMVHADVLGNQFFWYKRLIAVMTLYDLCATSVRINLGEWALAYMPRLSLGDSVPRDWAHEFEVLAKAFWYGFVDETQRAELMAEFGMPKPGPAPTEPKANGATADVNGEPVPPAGQRPDNTDRGRKQPESALSEAELRAAQFERLEQDVKAYESRLHAVGHNPRRRSSFVGYLPRGTR